MSSGIFSSIFRGIFGSENENESEQEMSEMTSPANANKLERHNNDVKENRSFNEESGKSNLERPTGTSIEDGYTEEERRQISEMLAEIAEQETGYSSEYHSEDSYENISLHSNNGQRDVFPAKTPISSPNQSLTRYSSGKRVLDTDEIQIEYGRHNSSKGASGHDKTSRDKDSAKQPTVSIISNVRFDTQGLKSGETNKAFEGDVDDDVITPMRSEMGAEGTSVRRRMVKERTLSATDRWQNLAANKDVIVSAPSMTRKSILTTNPLIAARLTQSYQRAKKRISEQHPTKWQTFKNVHLKRLKAKLRYFIDHNADSSYQFKKKKYYWESSSSSDEDDVTDWNNPYSIKKKKWWMKKPKTGNERLKRYKFFGKMIFILSRESDIHK